MGFLHSFTRPEEDRQVGRNIGGLENVSYLHLCLLYIYILLDGLSFASCVVFFRAPQGRGKMRAMSKMSASIIC